MTDKIRLLSDIEAVLKENEELKKLLKWQTTRADLYMEFICEMIADWMAACKRHADGDIMKSIEINQKRFGYSDELKEILINTVTPYMEE